MDLGILVLRIILVALLWGHATQKLFGWFHGQGIGATAQLFERWGLRPGRPFVILSGTAEILGGALLLAGFLTPAGATIIVGSMTVAVAYNWAHGLWAHRGGYEVALVYGLLAIVVCLTGPGAYSLDASLGLDALSGPTWAAAAAAGGAAGATVPILLRGRTVGRDAPGGELSRDAAGT